MKAAVIVGLPTTTYDPANVGVVSGPTAGVVPDTPLPTRELLFLKSKLIWPVPCKMPAETRVNNKIKTSATPICTVCALRFAGYCLRDNIDPICTMERSGILRLRNVADPAAT